MSELEELIQRIETEKAFDVNSAAIDAILFLLRQQRLIPQIDETTSAGPAR